MEVRCRNCGVKACNCDTGASNHVGAIARLSESEGVFTTAQAKRMGIPRDALHDAVESGRLEIGDPHLSPYRIYASRRMNTRNPSASFARREVARNEVMFASGLPVTCPERTVFDLVVDDEELSLVADVLGDASRKFPDFDYGRLQRLLEGRYGERRGRGIHQGLMEDSGLLGKEAQT